MITNALRSLWAEPRAPGVPERVSRDWVLVGALMVTALLEGLLRDDVAWRPFVTIVALPSGSFAFTFHCTAVGVFCVVARQ